MAKYAVTLKGVLGRVVIATTTKAEEVFVTLIIEVLVTFEIDVFVTFSVKVAVLRD